MSLPIAEAVGLALDEDIVCPVDLPPFDRSIMDGFAVRAADTSGASESSPASFTIVGAVAMGEATQLALASGQAVAIPTGGMLPAGADAVVMVEHTRARGRVDIDVLRPVTPEGNTVRRGADVRAGDLLLRAGHRLRPQDISALAGLGNAQVRVRRPRVAVLSTGSELVAHEQPAEPGKVRDMNGPALSAAVRAASAEPVPLGLVGDGRAAIRAALDRGIADADIVLVSGGTSVGSDDVVGDLIGSLGPPGILVHGLALKPGKPCVVGLVGDVPVFGMPGHPASCLMVFRELVAPLLRAAVPEPLGYLPLSAFLSADCPAEADREQLVPVRLARADAGWEAGPLLGPSAFISTLVAADGLVRVPAGHALRAGDMVEVEPLS